MNDNSTLEIESYLGGDMNPDERKDFETRLTTDPELQSLFNIYKNIDERMRQREQFKEGEETLKETIQHLNQSYFKTTDVAYEASTTPAVVIPINPGKRLRRIAVAVAAAIVVIVGGYWAFQGAGVSTQGLAGNYVKNELATLSQTMSASADSLQQGIAAYNQKDYPKALELFNALYKSNPDNNEALKYAGITYLATQKYDEAINVFDALSAKQLFSNEGPFLKAVTLMTRNNGSDKQTAKQLLQEVVNQKQEKSEVAAEWLSNWD